MLDECENDKFPIKDRVKYYIRVQDVLKTFDKLIVAEKNIIYKWMFS